MVVTLVLGCLKLIYAHWRLRKFSAIAEQERVEQTMQRSMSQRTQTRGPTSDDVPFGIRAIESGIEVEDLWISRGNTPEPTPSETSQTDFGKQDLSMRDTARGAHRSTSRSEPPPLSPLDPATRPTGRRGSHKSSVDINLAKLPRVKYPPVSYAKYDTIPYISRQSIPITALGALDAVHKASTSLYDDENNTGSDSSNQSSNSTGGVDAISASAPDLFAIRRGQLPRLQSSSDVSLNLLNNHRASQVAETGQFTPRGRRQVQSCSVDLAGLGRPTRTSTSTERTYVPEPRSATRSSSSETGSPTTLLSTPKIAALPPAVRRSSMPDVTPFTEFCKRTSRPASPRATSRDSAQSHQIKSETHSPIDSGATSPIMPASAGAAELKLPPPERTSFERRKSAVVRGHGTGFEILLPGSLKPALPEEHPLERQRAVPPISLQNSKNKLQKKRRPSMDSTSSCSTKSRRSRISIFA